MAIEPNFVNILGHSAGNEKMGLEGPGLYMGLLYFLVRLPYLDGTTSSFFRDEERGIPRFPPSSDGNGWLPWPPQTRPPRPPPSPSSPSAAPSAPPRSASASRGPIRPLGSASPPPPSLLSTSATPSGSSTPPSASSRYFLPQPRALLSFVFLFFYLSATTLAFAGFVALTAKNSLFGG
jgi:hypothetical protein